MKHSCEESDVGLMWEMHRQRYWTNNHVSFWKKSCWVMQLTLKKLLQDEASEAMSCFWHLFLWNSAKNRNYCLTEIKKSSTRILNDYYVVAVILNSLFKRKKTKIFKSLRDRTIFVLINYLVLCVTCAS